MTKISALVELLGAGVDQANDLFPIVDMSEVGAARNKFIKVIEFLGVITDLVGMLQLKGSTDCSSNPNYPAAEQGDTYRVSVAGKIGGASGVDVEVGDVYYALADNAGGTQGAVGSSWDVIQGNTSGGSINFLDDIGDVDVPTPPDGYVLTYDASNQIWYAAASQGGGGSGSVALLDDIGDVDVATKNDGDALLWDESNQIWYAGSAVVPAGTAFPSSPNDRDRFYRTDRDIEYFYQASGSRWLSTQQKELNIKSPGDTMAASSITSMGLPYNTVYDIYVEEIIVSTNMLTSGTFTVQPFRFDGATFNSLFSADSTAGDATNTYINRRHSAFNTVLSKNEEAIQVNWTRTSGTMRGSVSLVYRLVG